MPDGAAMTAAPALQSCFHCGQDVPPGSRWSVAIDGAQHAMCCPGCEAVAKAIVDLGQADYYRNRSAYAARADAEAPLPSQLALYNDDPRFAGGGEESEAILLVEGIRCAACVWLIERRLMQLDGVVSASMNVSTERLALRWHKDRIQLSAILQALRQIGYTAFPYDAVRHTEQLRKASRTLGRQLFVAGLSMMQVMMYVAPEYLAEDGTLDASMTGLMRWASLLLTLPAIVYSAQPFLRGAWASLRARTLGMDVPVALGIVAAFAGSIAATWRGRGEVYFDSVTMFIFLLLASRYLEMAARRKAATALERLQHALPASATLLSAWPAPGEGRVVPAASLARGDVIMVKPGETVAADGVIVEGRTALDFSLLTGESAPQTKSCGDEVPGGAVNASAMVLVRVERSAAESTLSGLLKLAERAGSAKPAIAQWADRSASWFVAGLLLFALASFGFWWWQDAARAWPVAIAVLVVSCPCALSLATPSALAAATDRLLGKGVLIVRPHVLETLHRATHIVFDKTGTLTTGQLAVQRADTFSAADGAQCVAIAAALEAGSAHPIARAIAAHAAQTGAPRLAATGLREVPGQGLEGQVGGTAYRIGNASHVAGIAGCLPPWRSAPDAGMSTVFLGMQGKWLACFTLSDTIREDARATLDYFASQGKHLVLLSGDREELVQRMARELKIERAEGGCLPSEKLELVQELQSRGAVVAMVGDGINDAAVLSAADVSFAMGSGSALAQVSADTVLLNGRIGAIADAARTASRTMRVIRQNLAWAVAYNIVAIPAAACGWLNPWLSGIGMAASSAVVVLNALRLRGK
ncbi:heavy metal translocating P-type ATPase [Massilia endophytica]|uniref:heavy metal translocating P-type ATPase n=1 Tax=Massilia endophytica TaxID=2899220 RepID=UPI001E562EE2|nr:heavy metal translocating P-type ATPase [Massilia endophytica]UGQ46436.1 heavy metal translocating P-type ATPase [Massilia endophytica]